MIKQKPMRDLALGALMALGGAGLLSTVQAGTLTRVSSDEILFGGQVVTTALTPPGSVFYQKTVTVPPGTNSLFITLSASVGTNAVGWLFCGATLPPGPIQPCLGATNGFDGAPNGWVVATHNRSGQVVTYVFCKKTAVRPTPSLRTVQLRVASSSSREPTTIEKASIYIDAHTGTGGACPGT